MKLSTTTNVRERVGIKRAKRRQDLINAVQRGLDMSGDALQELRDDEHWKDTHNSFAEFCKATFNISKTKLYTVLKRLELTSSLPKHLQSSITSDAQVIALSKLPENKRVEAVEKAQQNGGVTAENIVLHGAKPASKTNVTNPVTLSRTRNSTFVEETGSETSSPKKTTLTQKDKKIISDENFTPIPDEALPHWEKEWGEEHKNDLKVQDILNQISRLKSIVVGGREKGELRWLKVTNAIENTFSSLYSLISEAKPYAVCTTCMGTPSLREDGCNFCKNTGLISKWQWDTQSRQEVKDIVLRRAADLKKEQHVH